MEGYLSMAAQALWFSAGSLAVFLLTKLAIAIWWKPLQIAKHFEAQGISGPPYKLLFGNAREYAKLKQESMSKPMKLSHDIAPRVQKFYPYWSKIYGETFLIWFGPKPVLVIGRSELAKEVLSDKVGIYGKPPWDPLLKELVGEGLVVLNGEKWANHRRIISPSFHIDKLKDMFFHMVASTCNMLEEWEKVVRNGEKELDVCKEFKALTSDIIARTAFGSSYLQGKHIFGMLSQQTSMAAEDARDLMIPGYSFLPFKRNRDRWRLHREIKNSLKQIILDREKAAINNSEGYGNDLLGSMMDTVHQLPSSENNPGLTIEEVIEECKTFFFAGQETTMNFLTFSIVVMAMHPQWQERARAEVLEVCGQCHPKFETLNKLKVLGMILNEVIRLYPPATAYMRETFRDTKLGGISIPTGTRILFPLVCLNHDTRLWGEDANEFNPERFSEGIRKAAKEDAAVFIPFGYGLRSCVGQNFAMVESKLAIAMILQHFSFEVSPGYLHAPTVFITMYAQHGAHILFHKLA